MANRLRNYVSRAGGTGPQNLGRGGLLRRVRVPGPKKGVPYTTGPPKGIPASSVPGAPGGPPAPDVPTPMPWDTNYETRVAGINRDRDTTLAGLQQQQVSLQQDYGFDDPSNPFNRIKMLERAYQQHKAGSTNAMASRGQLYSGAAEQEQAGIDYGAVQSRDTLRRSYDQSLADLQARRLRAQTSAQDALSAADYQRTLDALANRPDPAEVTPEPMPTTTGAGMTAAQFEQAIARARKKKPAPKKGKGK